MKLSTIRSLSRLYLWLAFVGASILTVAYQAWPLLLIVLGLAWLLRGLYKERNW